MKAQLKLQLGALQEVSDTTQDGADRYTLNLDFKGLNLEFEVPVAWGTGGQAPAAWRKLQEAFAELATLAAEHRAP